MKISSVNSYSNCQNQNFTALRFKRPWAGSGDILNKFVRDKQVEEFVKYYQDRGVDIAVSTKVTPETGAEQYTVKGVVKGLAEQVYGVFLASKDGKSYERFNARKMINSVEESIRQSDAEYLRQLGF